MDGRDGETSTRKRSAVFRCAVAASIVIAAAGAGMPFYAQTRFVVVFAVVLIAIAAVIAAFLWHLRSQDDADSESMQPQTLAAVAARAPLELAPDELRKQLETLRHTQGELLLAKQAAEAAMMAKGEFLATMSHEIRTPLNGVLPLLELVLSSPLQPDQREYLSTAYASARELLRIVDAILDYSKLDAERLELETVGLNLRDLVNGVAQLMQRNADAKSLRLNVTIDPAVRLAVRGDPVRLRQVLTNLVSNAIKFTDRGGVQIQVSKRSETREHHEIVFAVRDSGVGIAPEVASKLFRPFSQADASTTRVFGGTGLGLAICKRLVDLMQGQIGVKSEPGKGSLFWFSVPLLKALGDLPVRRGLDGIRAIALIDDDVVMRRVQAAGATLGVEITQARTLADALSGLRASANMGERWRHSLLIVDGAAFKTTAATAARNVIKDSALGHVRCIIWNYGGTDLPQDARLRAMSGHLAEESLRTALEPLFGVQDPGLARVDTAADAVIEIAPVTHTPLHGRVLLVEDNAVNRRVAQRLLDMHGLDVTPVNDGREAIGHLERQRFDLVLMDCLMPVMDGYTATRAWRERERATGSGHLPIVAMTANAMAGDREKCLAAGMDDYISKPLDRAALVQILRRWLPAGDVQRAEATAAAVAAPALMSGAALPAIAQPIASPAAMPPVAVEKRAPASTPATSGPPAIDATIIRDLLDTMGQEFGDLVRVYLEDAPQHLHALEAAAAIGDAAAQIAPAHTLKSSSANIGAMSLSDLSRGIEQAARAGIATGPAEIAAGIRPEYERVAAELSKLSEKA